MNNNNGMYFYALTPFTLIDYPGKTACVIWISGCNMRCPYCHNTEMIKPKSIIHENEIMKFLEKRKNILDSVVFSGGECTTSPGLFDFIKKIKHKYNYKIKIDTNGLNPYIIEKLIKNNLIDYVALDFKAPKSKFDFVTKTKNKYHLFEKTLDVIIKSKNIEKEIRTTVHTNLIDEYDINTIIDVLNNKKYNNTYYIQNYVDVDLNNTMIQQINPLNKESIKHKKIKVEYRNF